VVTIGGVGVLECENGERCQLWADHLVGRSPESALQLQDASVSWRHASVRWTGSSWELQDLGSLNGTFVNGTRVQVGARVALRFGVRVRFGASQPEWLVADLDPPEAVATALDDGTRVTAHDGLIALPSAEAPEVSLFRRLDGVWIAEAPDRVWEPRADELIVAAGRRFRFEPGSVVFATLANISNRLTSSGFALEFAVSRNEEQVDITILYGSKRIPLKARAHSYLLLTLARMRLQDQANASLPNSSHGWVEQQRLLRMLATHLAQLTLDVYRARRQFAEAGVADFAQVVERRTGSRELRLGVEQIKIVTH
jgi:hypothetical protein